MLAANHVSKSISLQNENVECKCKVDLKKLVLEPFGIQTQTENTVPCKETRLFDIFPNKWGFSEARK